LRTCARGSPGCSPIDRHILYDECTICSKNQALN
jgi:hypothetical protein